MKDLKKICICLATGILCVLTCLASDSDTASMSHYSTSDDESDSDTSIASRRSTASVTVAYIEHQKELTTEEEDEFADFPTSSSMIRQRTLTLTYNIPSLQPTTPTKVVLTIDGGGSRGIIPLFFLNELQRRLSAETGQLIEKLPIDIYAGTSVGALIATAAAAGKVDELHQRYTPLVNKIFSYSWWKWPFTKLFRGYGYTSNGRSEVILSFLTPKTEENIESDLIIPFCSAKTHDVFTYTNYDETPKFALFDALMAASAAPTYFPPHIFTGLDGVRYEGTDGGCFANHPGLIALLHAVKKYPHSKIVMISLGTGHCRAAGNTTKDLNLLNWATTVPGLFMNLHSIETNEILTELAACGLRHNFFTYIRINPVLDRIDCITDGASAEHLEHLETVARQSISHNGHGKGNFDRVVNILKEQIRYSR